MSDLKSSAERAAARINAKVAGYSGSIVGSFQDWMESVILEEAKTESSPETPRDDLWKFICDIVCDPKKSWPKAAEIIREEVLKRAGVSDLRKANSELNAELMKEALKADAIEAEFKNFHRALCDRFGYIHDDIDWKRDQVSLEEFIASKLKPIPTPQPDGLLCLDRNGTRIKVGDIVEHRSFTHHQTIKEVIDDSYVRFADTGGSWCAKNLHIVSSCPEQQHRDFDSEWLNYHDYIKSVAKAEYNNGSSMPAAIELATDNARHVFGITRRT